MELKNTKTKLKKNYQRGYTADQIKNMNSKISKLKDKSLEIIHAEEQQQKKQEKI